MVQVSDIKWGSYKNYEGPFYPGKHKFALPTTPIDAGKARGKDMLQVITATEGGAYDAFNGYDRCGWSSGLIQFCEAGYYLVSDMLGEVYKELPEALNPLREQLRNNRVTFHANEKNRYRFFFDDSDEIDTKTEQNRLFYLGGDGTKGTWTGGAIENARRWAAAISSVWESQEARDIQEGYTLKKLRGYVIGDAKKYIDEVPANDLGNAIEAAYLSFAINNPTRARNGLKKVTLSTGNAFGVYSMRFFIELLRELTFGPNIVIYPDRYDAIAPAIINTYGIDVPTDSKALASHKESSWEEGYTAISVSELQRALLNLHYDIGSRGLDGIFGPKTKEALMDFERMSGHKNPDGYPDEHTLYELESDLEEKGLKELRGCVCSCTCGIGPINSRAK